MGPNTAVHCSWCLIQLDRAFPCLSHAPGWKMIQEHQGDKISPKAESNLCSHWPLEGEKAMLPA